MKRIANPENVWKICPLFMWHKCGKCKYEFRRENIWTTLGGPIVGGNYTRKYFCLGCCPTIQDAHNEADRISSKPPPPPTPPPVRIIKQ